MTIHEHRFVDLEGAHNFRDLGGLPTGDGGTTRFGVMFRSDALHHLKPTDLELLTELGMRMVIDLRSSVEFERTGRGPLEDTPIGWLHAPLSDVARCSHPRWPRAISVVTTSRAWPTVRRR